MNTQSTKRIFWTNIFSNGEYSEYSIMSLLQYPLMLQLYGNQLAYMVYKAGLRKQRNNSNNTSVHHRKHVLYIWKETKRDKERDGKGKTERGGVNTWSEHAFTNIRISRRRISIIEYQKLFECTKYLNIRCSPSMYICYLVENASHILPYFFRFIVKNHYVGYWDAHCGFISNTSSM